MINVLPFLSRNEKQGKLKQVGLAEANRTQIKNRIKTKVGNNYIYNLRYDEQHDVMLFNMKLNSMQSQYLLYLCQTQGVLFCMRGKY
jgi:hypothetical protein